MTVLRDERVRTWWWLLAVLASCSASNHESVEVSRDDQAVSVDACTAVALTSPSNDFVYSPGDTLTLTGIATCPAGQTPEYQYWAKHYGDSNWLRVTPRGTYLPGSTTWTPPTGQRWCVTVVARAVGAPEEYQVRANSRCSAPRCGNGDLEAGEQCDDGNLIDGDGCNSNCTVAACGNGIIDAGEQCDDGNTRNNDGCDATCQPSALTYVKASNTRNAAVFGHGVALSADGSTLAIGAYNEDGGPTPYSPQVIGAGAVYVYTRTSNGWSGPIYLKAAFVEREAMFGYSVALSADGSTLAVGAYGERAGTGVLNAGAAYVFTRSAGVWSQQAYLEATHPEPNEVFGWRVALSSDGSTLAVSSPVDHSGATGIDGDDRGDGAVQSGGVFMFKRSGTTWTRQAYIKASNTGELDNFGWSLALSGDGRTLAVGARHESSAATGVDGDQSSDAAERAGAVYIFGRSAGGAWSQQHYLKASNTTAFDGFGESLALSRDGATLAVGAPQEASAATGIEGDQLDDSKVEAGAVYVFARDSSTWQQTAYLKATNTDAKDRFGSAIALADDGAVIAVGATQEASNTSSDPSNNSTTWAGAVYTYTRTGASWSPTSYIKAPNAEAYDQFGDGISMASDGTLAVGAVGEDSKATGLGGNQADNSLYGAGAVYLFR